MTTTALMPSPVARSAPDAVISCADLRAAGLSNYAISSRCGPSGPWQRPFPGVVLLTTAPPTRRQRVRASLLYAGPHAVLTGTDALVAHGVPVSPADEVLVLVPETRRVVHHPGLVLERTTRLPPPECHDDLPVAPLDRAVIDAARREPDQERLRTLLRASVRTGRCNPAQLRRELNQGNQRNSASVRALLTGDFLNDVIPVTLSMAKRLLRSAPLPPPRWQVPLHTLDGTPLGVADAWWPEAGLAWNLGTQQDPLPTGEQWLPTLTIAGITVLHTDLARLRTSPTAVLTELAMAFAYASANPHRRP